MDTYDVPMTEQKEYVDSIKEELRVATCELFLACKEYQNAQQRVTLFEYKLAIAKDIK